MTSSLKSQLETNRPLQAGAKMVPSRLWKLLSKPLITPLLAPLLALTFFVSPESAGACRDCPFPMKVAEGTWLMPNRRLEIEIEEISLSGGWQETVVWVRRSETSEVLAIGTTRLRKGKKVVNLVLYDKKGQPIETSIHWLDFHHDMMQINFICGKTCSLNEFLD